MTDNKYILRHICDVCNAFIDIEATLKDGALQNIRAITHDKEAALAKRNQPIPMLLHCPMCKERHIDIGEFSTKAHHTHACQKCGHVWRPAVVPTVGVDFLPGFKNV